MHPTPTHRPNLYYIQQNSSAAVRTSEQQCSRTYSTAEQQCSSTYIRTAVQQYVQQYTPGTRGTVSWLVLMKQETAKKKLPCTERPTHPPRTTQCTLHPPTDQTFTTYSTTAVQQYVHQNSSAAVCTSEQQCSSTYSTAEQQCSSTYIRTAVQQYVQQYTPGTRGAVSWLVLMKQETAKKKLPRTERPTHPPRTTQCTLHPPTDQTFTTYSRTAVQQYVHQNSSAAVCTSEQQCSSTYSTAEHHPPCTHEPTQYSSTAMQQYLEQYT